MLDLTAHKILLTNDDGYQAEGINALYEALVARGCSVTMIAPAEEQSECGHSVTSRSPLRIEPHARGHFVFGRPADCVRLGIWKFANDATLVISGINHGGNLGADIWMSGTVAAAREAATRGVPAFAVSQYRRADMTVPWSVSAERAIVAISTINKDQLQQDRCWNVNLPAIEADANAEICFCEVDPNPMSIRYEESPEGLRFASVYHDRPREPDHDIDVCFGGRTSISRLPITTSSKPERAR